MIQSYISPNMFRVHGPLARRLILLFVFLAAIQLLISFGGIGSVLFVERTLGEVISIESLAENSARMRAETLTLTYLVDQYVSHKEDSQITRELINEQKIVLENISSQVLLASNPLDLDQIERVNNIREALQEFTNQAQALLDSHDSGQISETSDQNFINNWIKNYQEPLIENLQKFENIEVEKFYNTRARSYQAVFWTVIILVIVLVLVGMGLYRIYYLVMIRLVKPLDAMRLRVEAISAGDLNQSVIAYHPDELGQLAQALNHMVSEVRISREQLQTYTYELECQVAERTQVAEQRSEQLERQTLQLQAAAEIAQSANSTLDLEPLLQNSVQLILESFNLHYVGMFLLNPGDRHLDLRAATGEIGKTLLETGFKLSLDENSMIGWCVLNVQPRIAQQVENEIHRYANPLLAQTQSEAALPLISRGEVIGAITAQSSIPNAFKPEDINALLILTGQLANAIGNARLYQELEHEKAAAEAASQAKSAFLANMSHEIRTPLNSILGFTELLETDPNLTEDQRQNVATVHRSSEALLNLINGILDLSKIEAGRMVLNEHAFDLHNLLRDIIDMIRLRAREKNLGLHLNLDPGVPQYIIADEAKIGQILLNLIGNAVKFTSIGQVLLRTEQVYLTPVLSPGEKQILLRFSVIDTGPGISDEDQGTLFEPFSQAEAGKRTHQGTGLGLAISFELVRLMGGNLELESQIGEGSTFSFTIPVSVPEIVSPSFGLRKRVVGLADGQPIYRLLIVEDLPDGREWLSTLLSNIGFEVNQAEDGEEALDICKTWLPHLVWMDIRLPGMDGRQAARLIRKQMSPRKVVIVAFTASSFLEQRKELMETGFDDFLAKPVRVEDIFLILERHLGAQFIYEEGPPKTRPLAPKTGSQEDGMDWSVLPEEITADLRKSAEQADFDQVKEIIKRIHFSYPDLARILDLLADRYDARGILLLLPGN